MRDIELLKQRIEAAEKHLNASEQARTRESDALMEMWRQIRGRFAAQESEIARYRAEMETMIQKNEALGRMVENLLATIEGSVSRARDETVPKITSMDNELLTSEPASAPRNATADDAPRPAPEAAPETETDGLSVTEAPELPDVDDAPPPASPIPDPETVHSVLDQVAGDDDGAPASAPAQESMSPGIRDLISRVERMSTGKAADDDDRTEDEAEDDELVRELREIESLRNELSGLRERISASGGNG